MNMNEFIYLIIAFAIIALFFTAIGYFVKKFVSDEDDDDNDFDKRVW